MDKVCFAACCGATCAGRTSTLGSCHCFYTGAAARNRQAFAAESEGQAEELYVKRATLMSKRVQFRKCLLVILCLLKTGF